MTADSGSNSMPESGSESIARSSSGYRGAPPALEWRGDARTGVLRLLDQTALPTREAWLDCADVETTRAAIRRLSVRGAPAIGVAAAYGMVLGARAGLDAGDAGDGEGVRRALRAAGERLGGSRPTAVNLFWAIARMAGVAARFEGSGAELVDRLLAEARAIEAEDAGMCRAIGEHGFALLEGAAETIRARGSARPLGVLTHCNAGALATAGRGTALAPIYEAAERGLRVRVFADETRPLLQGARLTAWELARSGIPVTVLCDNAAAVALRGGGIDLVIVGADRIAANGDAANKIGTYGLAALARTHGVPFFVAAPSTTFDRKLSNGEGIPIEHRSAEEVATFGGVRTTPELPEVDHFNPAFDVTPAEWIAGIVTERGIVRPVNAETVARVLGWTDDECE